MSGRLLSPCRCRGCDPHHCRSCTPVPYGGRMAVPRGSPGSAALRTPCNSHSRRGLNLFRGGRTGPPPGTRTPPDSQLSPPRLSPLPRRRIAAGFPCCQSGDAHRRHFDLKRGFCGKDLFSHPASARMDSIQIPDSFSEIGRAHV